VKKLGLKTKTKGGKNGAEKDVEVAADGEKDGKAANGDANGKDGAVNPAATLDDGQQQQTTEVAKKEEHVNGNGATNGNVGKNTPV
jgi:hypothetical protein